MLASGPAFTAGVPVPTFGILGCGARNKSSQQLSAPPLCSQHAAYDEVELHATSAASLVIREIADAAVLGSAWSPARLLPEHAMACRYQLPGVLRCPNGSPGRPSPIPPNSCSRGSASARLQHCHILPAVWLGCDRHRKAMAASLLPPQLRFL